VLGQSKRDRLKTFANFAVRIISPEGDKKQTDPGKGDADQHTTAIRLKRAIDDAAA
jgi:hypothetical protein